MKNLIAFANSLLSLGVLLITASLFYVVFLERPYLSYGGKLITVINKTLMRGDAIPLKIVRCNSDDKMHSYLVYRSIVKMGSNLHYDIPERQTVILPGCHEDITATSFVPLNAPLGFYQMVGTASVNGILRTFEVEWKTEIFEVRE